MTERGKPKKELLLEIEELKLRLAEAEDTLRAIQRGEVDAIIGDSSSGDRVYTLQGAEHPYRVFFEAMNEGAVTTTLDGTILYCNRRFADLSKVPLEKVTGMSLLDFVSEDSRQSIKALLLEAGPGSRSIESALQVPEGVLPVNISMNPLKTSDIETVCAVVTDLSALKLMSRLEEYNERLSAINEKLQASERELRDSRRATLNIMEDAVAARKRAEEISTALRENEEKLRLFIEHAPAAIAMLDADMKYIGASRRWYKDYQLQEQDIVGRSHYDVFPDLPLKWKEVHGRCLAGEIARNEADPWPRADGRTNWVRWEIRPWYRRAGEVGGLIIFSENITKLKEAEIELQALNENLERRIADRTRFYNVLAQVNEAIVRIRDRDALLNEVCRIVVETGGFVLAWLGVADPVTLQVHPVASAGDVAYLEGIRIVAADVPEGMGPTGRAIVEGRQTINMDYNDESMGPWRERAQAHGIRSSTAFPVLEGDRIFGAFTIYSDRPGFFITGQLSLLGSLVENLCFALEAIKADEKRAAAEGELRRLNDELELRVRRRTAELEDANRELESFVYSVSHDLRAPLRSIAGFTKIVTEEYAGKLDEQGRDYLGRIARGSDKMSRLIDDLLNLSRISSQDVVRTRVDLSTMAASIISGLREAQPGREAGVEIGQGISAMADPRLMELALSNLLGNSWKFTSRTTNPRIEFGVVDNPSTVKGSVPDLRTERRGDVESGLSPAPIYYVKDNGVGFDSSYAEKMFLPFHRLHADAEYEGTGIGLSIVERVIRRHGGRIWAEGSPGKGAVVYFTLG